jgi:lysophospholipase L1-like esterase
VRRRLAALLALLVLLGVGAGIASAACGGVEQEKPRKDVNLGRAPIAIGDSPMLLALPNLAAEGYRANARGCRQWPEGLDVIRGLRQKDHLPRLVVVALGSNGSVTRDDIHTALDLLGKKRTLGLVTPREAGGGSSSDADVVRSEADKHKNRIVLLDWVKYSSGHTSWFQPDGLHLTFDGAEAFADLLKKPLKDLPKPH